MQYRAAQPGTGRSDPVQPGTGQDDTTQAETAQPGAAQTRRKAPGFSHKITLPEVLAGRASMDDLAVQLTLREMTELCVGSARSDAEASVTGKRTTHRQQL